jgi:hypothetical protein
MDTTKGAVAQATEPINEAERLVRRLDHWTKTFPDSIIGETAASALVALAAERDRADRAEARLAEAWDEGAEYAVDYSTAPLYDNPYRAEATA